MLLGRSSFYIKFKQRLKWKKVGKGIPQYHTNTNQKKLECPVTTKK